MDKNKLTEDDMVNSPAHYNFAGVECIDAIRAATGEEGFSYYLQGNIMKYLWRYRYKNGGGMRLWLAVSQERSHEKGLTRTNVGKDKVRETVPSNVRRRAKTALTGGPVSPGHHKPSGSTSS